MPFPIYELSACKSFALVINFQSLFKVRRGYSYRFFGKKQELTSSVELGIYNFKNKEYNKIVDIDSILKHHYHTSMNDSNHWIDHPMFSPDSKKIIFYHRWKKKSNIFFTRLYSINIDSKNLFMYNDLGSFSHAHWIDNDSFLITSKLNNQFAGKNISLKSVIFSLIKPVYKIFSTIPIIKGFRKNIVTERYLKFIHNNSDYDILLSEFLKLDGHPSPNPIFPWIWITDTYPDEHKIQHLIIIDFKNNKTIEIGEFITNAEISGDNRCDLHPRWNPKGNKVCFDSTHTGERQLHIINISNLIEKLVR